MLPPGIAPLSRRQVLSNQLFFFHAILFTVMFCCSLFFVFLVCFDRNQKHLSHNGTVLSLTIQQLGVGETKQIFLLNSFFFVLFFLQNFNCNLVGKALFNSVLLCMGTFLDTSVYVVDRKESINSMATLVSLRATQFPASGSKDIVASHKYLSAFH